MKKVLSLTAFCCFFVLFAITAFAEKEFPDAKADPALKLRVELFDSEEAYADVLELPGYEDIQFYLFLPADCDRSSLTVRFSAERLSVNGKELISGEKTDVFKKDGDLTIEAPEGQYIVRVISSANLPSVYISTETGSLETIHADKANKEKGSFTLVENGEATIDNAQLSYIKGRGNSSWQSNEKKCYNIKFAEKTGLLGMKKAKKWALISNNMDPTLMRNAMAYSAAKYTSLPYTVDFRFVDLYINGIYRGNYLIVEKVEVGGNRIAIADLDDANAAANPGVDIDGTQQMESKSSYPWLRWKDIPNDPDDISGGYLLEFEYPDAFETEAGSFVTPLKHCLLVHSPEKPTKGEISYIAGLYCDFEEALYSADGYNKKGKHYLDYIDSESFIDGLLLNEFTQDSDSGHTSWYIFLPEGSEKFVMGPVWDFDSAFMSAGMDLDCISALCEAQYAKGRARSALFNENFIRVLYSYRETLDAMAERFPEIAESFETSLNAEVSALFEKISVSAAADAVRWGYSPVGSSSDLRVASFITERTKKMRDDFENLDERVAQGLSREAEKPSQPTTDPYRIRRVLLIAAAGIAGIGLVVGGVVYFFKRH